MADALQYGALGLLAVFVAAFWAWQREESKRRDEETKRQAEATAKMMQYLQDLVTSAIQSMQALVKESATAQLQAADTLSQLCRTVELHADKSEERHLEILAVCGKRARSG